MLLISGIVFALELAHATGIVCLMILLYFRRPIEMQGFVFCLAGYLFFAAITCGVVLPEWTRLKEFVHIVYFFLVPSLLALMLAFPVAYIVRRHCSPWPIIAVSLIPFAFGLTTGYLHAWLDRHGSAFPPISWSALEALVSCAGVPGDMITNQLVLDGADWQGGEMGSWGDKVALWNGIVWTIVCAAVSCPIYLTTRRYAIPAIDKKWAGDSGALNPKLGPI